MGKTARNELKKLKASWYNSLSTAFISVGLLSPAVAQIFGAINTPFDVSLIIFAPMICLGASAVFHFAGRNEIRELED
jgi:hypothetical protein